MDKVCAFCSRGEKSLLGQGELTCYEPTSGFNPFKRQLSRIVTRRALSETDEITGRRGQQSLTWRRTRGPLRQQSRCANRIYVVSYSQTQNCYSCNVSSSPLVYCWWKPLNFYCFWSFDLMVGLCILLLLFFIFIFLRPTSTKPQAEILKLNNVNGCNDISFGDHSILEGDRIPPLKSHGQALEEDLCFRGVLSDNRDAPDILLRHFYGCLMPCTCCLDGKRTENYYYYFY